MKRGDRRVVITPRENAVKPIVAIALAGTLALGGCATDPYGSYGTYYEGYRPYAYDVPYYSYGPAYVYPSPGATFYFRDDDDRDHWRDRGRDDRGRDWRGRDRNDRDRDNRGRGQERNDWRGPVDSRHGEAGNEAGMR